MKNLIALISGLIFALGLGLSGMTEPHIVRGFLDFSSAWDWRLLLVMVGAIVTHALALKIILKRKNPILDEEFYLPVNKSIDLRLIFGAILFGLGWGWVGICPGPGIVAVSTGKLPFVIFVMFMILGMKLFQIVSKNF